MLSAGCAGVQATGGAGSPAGGALAQPAATAGATVSGYRTPPAPITQILDAAPTPLLSLSPDQARIAYLGRTEMPGIEQLAEPELRLAGTRINPLTGGPSRGSAFNSITLDNVEGGARREVRLPEGARVDYVQWSPDGSRLAFANTVANGIELWVADARTAEARRVLGPELNAALGSPFDWAPDGRSLLVKRNLPNRGAAPVVPQVPGGPVIQETLGQTAPVRTYQDLLTGPYDEQLFEYYFTSQLARVPAVGGQPQPIGAPGIISSFSVAPGGEYTLVNVIKRPFSYLAPLFAFASEANVLDARGNRVYQVQDRPEVVLSPIGRDMVNPGPRWTSWRADAPATLVWAEAVDEGDARRAAPVRDRVLMITAPFSAEPRTLIELDQRFAGITWGRDDLALVNSRWATTARTRTYLVNPSQPGAAPRMLVDRSAEDRYADPGSPITALNDVGFRVLRFAPGGDAIYLSGQGASPRGNYPMLDRLDLRTGQTERLWQAEDPHYENVVALLDDDASRLLTRRETLTEPPNYFIRDRGTGSATALTDFEDPAPQLAGIQRQIITYPRADGVMLSATLFTPPGYDAARDGRLPVVLWAYPREFRDADAASQITDSPNRFSRPGGSSHLFLLTQGYAILDGPAMPIIGEGDVEPNDTYIEQLVSSARAAVDKVVEMGVGDRDRFGVGGHSYGAFMTANLLAHSDLFRAGIARSGAYNRTLTPFGFQAEPRSYWEAQEVYLRMSPFNYANQINEPILLIHGEADNNSGTFPIQSERMYQALKGHGATVRYVVLPHESHGYAARESVMHTLAEMVEWMDRYVKNAGPRTAAVQQGGG
ncbi:MAG: prolyl oligopeptidase family serine peptidase [Gemmatimonadetes bacterium]|nr:prolyl oligopeptidase family serine peptidase [Gemmatimonadota bacterium]